MSAEKLRDALDDDEPDETPEFTDWLAANREMLEKTAQQDHAFAPIIRRILERYDRGEFE